ncbi:MAG: sugar ABC transporter permease [Romboutsia sp.]|uniref:sugar ABC transporter permease n=1 Tax=Romboutsia sp. TaxID=1965302 RepID=UPI003F3CD671
MEKVVYKKKLNKTEKRVALLSRLVIWAMILIVMFPIVAVVSASMADGQTFTQASLFPKTFTLENYKAVLEETDFLIWVKNTVIISLSVAVIQLFLTIPSAFAFSRLKFWGRKKGLMMFLLLQMFPAAMALPAILGIAYRLNAMDNIWALVIIQCGGSAYNIWLMKGFIDGIPKELTEAAYMDGASTLETFVKVILPLTKNMLIVIFLFSFIGSYSEFVFSSALLKDPSSQTIATGLKGFITGKFSANWTQYSAAAIMACLPIVGLFTISQKYIAEGLVSGSVKG